MNRRNLNSTIEDQSYKDTPLSPIHCYIKNDEQSADHDNPQQQLTDFNPQKPLNGSFRHRDRSEVHSSGYVSQNDSCAMISTASANPEQQSPSQYLNKTTSKREDEVYVYTGDSLWILKEKKEAFKDLQAYTCPLHPCYMATEEFENKTQAFTCPQCEKEGF